MEGSNIHKRPFMVKVKGLGNVLVLKYVKMCDVPDLACDAPTASCILKVDPPRSPSCDRRPAPPSPPACPRTPPACPLTPPGASPGATPFMRTQMLESLFSTAKTNGEQLCRRQ